MVTYIIVAVLAGFLVGLFLQRAACGLLRFRGTRVVRCPENRQLAAVELSPWHAVMSVLWGRALPHVRTCSRWPERRACDQACVKEIRNAPAATLVETILANWCHYNACFYCGAPLAHLPIGPHQPHLIDRDMRIFEWKQIPPQDIPQTLRRCEPVCENCVVAETHTW